MNKKKEIKKNAHMIMKPYAHNISTQEFVITVWRNETNKVGDLDTRLRHSDIKKVLLSNKQKDIVNFCSVLRTTKEILDRIGVSVYSTNRDVRMGVAS